MHYPELPARPAMTDSQPDSPTELPMASKANLRSSGREAALARRRALSSQGKQGLVQTTPERSRDPRPTRARPQQAPASSTPAPAPAPTQAPLQSFDRSSSGSAQAGSQRQRSAPPSPSQNSRELARQRRAKLARDGRRAQRSGDRTRAQTARQGGDKAPAQNKSDCGCGCNGKGKGNGDRSPASNSRLVGNSKRGEAAQPSLSLSAPMSSNQPQPSNRKRKPNPALATKPAGRAVALARRAALSGRGKGATNVPHSVAGIARQANPKLSGRELAQRVRAQRSSNGGAGERKSQPTGRVRPTRTGAVDQPWKVGVTETSHGQFVTGTRVGRSMKTTGDEPSTCRAITGTEYMGADIFREFCQTDPVPSTPKIGLSPTGYGNFVSGNEVGRSRKVTGDEPGTCASVTGTQYLSPDQYVRAIATPGRLRSRARPVSTRPATTRGCPEPWLGARRRSPATSRALTSCRRARNTPRLQRSPLIVRSRQRWARRALYPVARSPALGSVGRRASPVMSLAVAAW